MFIHTGIRTDIPAFYSKWFMERIRQGEVYVRNPLFKENINKYELNPSVVDCLIFCTKNPTPMLCYLDELIDIGYNMLWYVTINNYESDIERNVPATENVVDSFAGLSNKLGREKVTWRYDPILINDKYTVEWHLRGFERLCIELYKYTTKCIFSFIDLYKKIEKQPGLRLVLESEKKAILEGMIEIANKYSITLQTCGEGDIYTSPDIKTSGCITQQIVEEAFGIKLKGIRPNKSREGCGCLATIDIGEYNTCLHGCTYCYATNHALAQENYRLHNPDGKILIGEVNSTDIVNKIKQVSNIKSK